MKSYRLFFYVSIILSAFLLFSCDDEPLDVGLEDGLPDTEMGSITFKVDGVLRNLMGSAAYQEVDSPNPLVDSSAVKGWQIMGGDVEGQEAESIGIQLFPAELETRRYDLDSEEQSIDGFFVLQYMTIVDLLDEDVELEQVESYSSISGYVDITDVDVENQKLTGTFKATVELMTFNDEELVTLEITEGKFINLPFIRPDHSEVE